MCVWIEKKMKKDTHVFKKKIKKCCVPKDLYTW